MTEEHAIPESTGADWRQLAIDIESRASALHDAATGTALADQAAALARDTRLLAAQIERLAIEAPAFLAHSQATAPTSTDPRLEAEIQREMIQIQRETHDGRVELMDIVKALFLWRDDPVERVRGRIAQD